MLPWLMTHALPAGDNNYRQGGPVLNIDGERRIHHDAESERGTCPGPGEERR